MLVLLEGPDVAISRKLDALIGDYQPAILKASSLCFADMALSRSRFRSSNII